ncbi:MAG: hypothetical protein V3V08_16180 [Nannocystaceae bacterium]
MTNHTKTARAKKDDKGRPRQAATTQGSKRKAVSQKLPTSLKALNRLAAAASFGPAWINLDVMLLDATDLISVIITRQLPGEWLLPGVVLVDRSCLGAKDGFVGQPIRGEEGIMGFVEQVEARGPELETCEADFARSVVWHAMDYATTLGFRPHVDVPKHVIGPRPEPLIDTPGAHPEKPHYVTGPYDDIPLVRRRLDAAVGPGNYEVVPGF